MCPEEKVWMEIAHNSSKPVSIQGSSFQNPHVMNLNYSASLHQLTTLMHRAQQCQQEVMYRCRKSRLFNTWGKSGMFRVVSGFFNAVKFHDIMLNWEGTKTMATTRVKKLENKTTNETWRTVLAKNQEEVGCSNTAIF